MGCAGTCPTPDVLNATQLLRPFNVPSNWELVLKHFIDPVTLKNPDQLESRKKNCVWISGYYFKKLRSGHFLGILVLLYHTTFSSGSFQISPGGRPSGCPQRSALEFVMRCGMLRQIGASIQILPSEGYRCTRKIGITLSCYSSLPGSVPLEVAVCQ